MQCMKTEGYAQQKHLLRSPQFDYMCHLNMANLHAYILSHQFSSHVSRTTFCSTLRVANVSTNRITFIVTRFG